MNLPCDKMLLNEFWQLVEVILYNCVVNLKLIEQWLQSLIDGSIPC